MIWNQVEDNAWRFYVNKQNMLQPLGNHSLLLKIVPNTWFQKYHPLSQKKHKDTNFVLCYNLPTPGFNQLAANMKVSKSKLNE